MYDLIKDKINIDKKDVLLVIATDLAQDTSLRFSFFVLTKQSLFKIENSKNHSNFNQAPFCDKEANVTRFDLKNCKNFSVSHNVSGITLSAEVEGEDTLVATSSNRFMPMVRVLLHALNTGVVLPLKEDVKPLLLNENRNVISRVWQYYKPHRVKVILIFLLVFSYSVISIFTPYLSGVVLFGKIINGVNPSYSAPITLSLLMLVVTLFAVQLVNQATTLLHSYITAKLTPFVMRNIKGDIFRKMSTLSVGFYQSRQTGTLMTRVLDDADRVSSVLIDHLPYLAIDVFTLLAVAVIMVIISPPLAVVTVLLLPISVVISCFLMPRMFILFGRRHRAQRGVYSRLNDNLTGARVVRVFGREAEEEKRFSKFSEGVKKAEGDIVKTESITTSSFSVLQHLSSILIYTLGAYFILSGRGNIGYEELVTFSGYVAMLENPLHHLAFIFRIYTDFSNSANRIFEILDAQPQVKEAKKPITVQNPRGEVEFKNVSFSYDTGRPVLKNVSFKAQGDKLLGVVGYSGAGKTTLLSLISRLYDTDFGEVLIDNVNIKDLSFAQLHQLIAVVSQETYIFMGTVKENIAYARPDATAEEIVSAAQAASAHDFIMKMPDGYDTVVGASGRELSGGERQRISIARAILSNPKILILDEATAAVDTQTEVAISQSIEGLIKGRTTISVAHRLSTLKNADSLIVLDEGEIVERGSHRELMKKKGLYFNLATLQTEQMIMKGEDKI